MSDLAERLKMEIKVTLPNDPELRGTLEDALSTIATLRAERDRLREALDEEVACRTPEELLGHDKAPKHDRKAILELVREDAQRSERGEPSICAGCENPISQTLFLYRCVECSLPFHLACIRRHFRESGCTPEESEREAIEDILQDFAGSRESYDSAIDRILALRSQASRPLIHDGHCTTCGTPVEIVVSDEGTHTVVPVRASQPTNPPEPPE